MSNRFQRLEKNGVIERVPQEGRGHRYELTTAGRDLQAVVAAMGRWGVTWAFEFLNEEELDPGLLLWRMQNRLNIEALPRERATIAFDFRTGRRGQLWFVINEGEASVCLTDPGFEIGLVVTADLSTLYQVWLGKMMLRHAVSKNLIRIEGLPAFEKALPNWFLWSPKATFMSSTAASDEGG